jgi:hypothetical protein
MTAGDQNNSADQNFMSVQEQIDKESNYMQLDTDDKYNAQSKKIKNVADGVAAKDAVNVSQIGPYVTAAQAAQTAAEAAQTAAETAETNAETAETNAAASAAAAAADAVDTAADAVSTAADAVSTAADAAATAADLVLTDADQQTVAADKAIVAADKATVAADKGIVAADKAIVAADKATTLGYKNAAETAKTAAETAQTAAETAQTAAELAETNAETAETNAETAETNAQAWAEGLFDPTPDTDHTAEGFKATMTVGETVALFDVLYMKSDGKLWKADADAEATMPVTYIALAAITANNSGEVGLRVYCRDDTWAWTVGGLIYVSTTPGAMTQTAPSGTGDIVQVIGVAQTADIILFNPDYAYAEIG